MTIDLSVHNLPYEEIFKRRNIARATLDAWDELGYLPENPTDEVTTEVIEELERCEKELYRRRQNER